MNITSIASRCIASRGALAIALAFGPGVASAQTAEAPPSAPQADAESQTGIGDIIVTAQKREQSAQKVPISIDVVGAATIQSRGIANAQALATVVPGFEFVRAPNQIPGLTFRGLGPQSGNVAFDSSIGMYVDGVFLGNIRLYNMTLFDVERAELIKGSQSALLGKNSTVGALSVVNQKPSDQFGGRIEAGGEAQNGGYFVDGALNVPLSNAISARISGRYDHDRGWITNVSTGLRGPVATNYGIRGQLSYDDGGPFNALVSYQHTSNKTIGSPVKVIEGLTIPPLFGPAGPGSGVAAYTNLTQLIGDINNYDQRASINLDPRLSNGDDRLVEKADLVSLTMNYDFGPATLTSITAGAWSHNSSNIDFGFNTRGYDGRFREESYHQFSQEVRLTSNDTSAPIQYILGGYFFSSKFHLDEDDVWKLPGFPPVPGPCTSNPAIGVFCPGDLYNGSYTMVFDQDDQTISVFGQLTWKPTDELTFNLGGRYSHDRKINSWGRTPDFTNLTFWNTIAQAPFSYQRLPKVTDDLYGGNLSAQYQFSPTAMVYASASRSGKAGGYGEFASVPADFTLPFVGGLPQGNPAVSGFVKPERANAYEIGFKTQFLDRMVQLNGAAFWTDLYNLQQLQFINNLFLVSNDRVRAKGVEGSIEVRPTYGLTIGGSATYADVKDLNSGKTIAQAPKFSGTAHIDYEVPISGDISLTLGSSLRYRSSKFNQLRSSPTDTGDPDGAFTTVGFRARLESEKGWFLNANIENAFNAIGADFGFTGVDPYLGRAISLAPRRTIWLSVGTKF